MAKNKTTPNDTSVAAYLETIADDQRRHDCTKLVEFLQQQSGYEPRMWGTGIVGFGQYQYRYDSGHEGEAPLLGLASRTNAITLYLWPDFKDKEELLSQLGKHKTGKSCIYLPNLTTINWEILSRMVQNSMIRVNELYPTQNSNA